MSDARRVGLRLLITSVFLVAFACAERAFLAPGGPDVRDLELSFTPGAFQQILLAWAAVHPEGVGPFKLTLVLLDFAFPVAYAALLAALYRWVVSSGGGEPLRAAVAAPWIAAAFDWLENLLLLALLWGLHDKEGIRTASFASGLVGLMSVAAALKFASLLVVLSLTFVALFLGARGRVLWRTRFGVFSLALGSVPLLVLPQARDLLVTLADPVAAGILPRIFFFVFLCVWAASVWYWSRVLLTMRFAGDSEAEADDAGAFARATPRVQGTATLALAAFAFLNTLRTLAPSEGPFWWLVGFAVVCAGLAVGFWILVHHRRRLLREAGIAVPEEPLYAAHAELPAGARRVAAVSFLVSGAFFVLFWRAPLAIAPVVGAVAILLVAAANTVFFGSVAVYLGLRWRVPLVTAGLIAAAGFSTWNDNHAVRLWRDASGAPSVTAPAARPSLARAFREWSAARPCAAQGCDDVPVYLVAASGGGIRAAYWTAGVLAHLRDHEPDVFANTFAVSGVSGGSVGAAVFAALARDAGQGALPCAVPDEAGRPQLEPCADRVLRGAFLAPTLAKLVAPDLAQWFLPLGVRSFDRAWALEDAWSAAYREATGRDTLAGPFLGLRPDARAGAPALLLNATHVQTGRRVVASPFAFSAADIPDSDDFLSLLGADVPLATAAHDSARFPYISPAGRLRTPDGEDRGHVVDGGYFENSGAATLRAVVKALRASISPAPRFVVLALCNDPERCHVDPFEPGRAVGWQRPANLAELFSPLRALLGAREARGSLALAELRRDTDPGFVELGVCARLATEQRQAPLPLGWQVSARVSAEIDRQVMDPQCGAARIPR
jgi:hypothetical protein